ncbi:biopolymer transporter ExbD [Marinicella sp. S1101]|uniref:ExbD/TolR family protein n=1 Tax=Marinicella marina TaxID=2996016 RepID=UPI002260FE67|nr:biopolymer transporter ExbD [Marinicella marina]MCX7554273.1 biopolymer transporter ExbD [Marinicella marina]MDJ1138736.1 biopolymer transporter ExbD [Marinicella marina]
MKNSYTKSTEENEINITPMMDVVFIMLIFFIVSTSFAKEEGIGITGASSTKPPNAPSEIVTIKLDLAGHSINGQVVALDAIKVHLSQLHAAKPDLKAQLFAANEIKIATLVRAIEQVKEAEVVDFSVSTY